MQKVRIGVDVGGTKIEWAVLDTNGDVLLRQRSPTPQHDYPATLQLIASQIQFIERNHNVRGSVGVGIPGTIDKSTDLVKNANSVWLNGHPMNVDLEQLLERPVRLQNDANCFALSEAADGAGQGAEIVFGVIVGTGCGSGVVVNGTVLDGANSIGGEWGHNSLPWPNPDETPGPECFCGQTGCIETFISGRGLSKRFEEQTGQIMTSQEICQQADRGDPEAERAMQLYEDRFARALASIINVVDPDVIVLGGGMSNIDRLYKNIPPLLPRFAMSPKLTTRLRKNVHGDSSGIRGAARLWPR